VDSILDPWDQKSDLPVLSGSPPDMAAPPAGCRFHPRCRHVMDVCRREEPATIDLPGGQRSKCWLHAPAEATA
jgi:oligopeptide/dipeptide ABC transporter ATP-binding protein